ncbi:MAG: DNA translocase FtsK [Candidatus Nomurabacteria bacterium]|jgi:S-DNA-T family DNA segregation ATPase FtsK/SpoIIIE|nr:DNA translocase FtsK [Candidatus Nomurabacteria bacterium]
MAKKKKRGPGRPPKKKAPEKVKHTVANGFWRQVGAVFLIVLSIILAVGLFDAGGTFPVGLAGVFKWLIGWAAWVVPLIFAWQAIQIFRAEDNRISNAIWVLTILFLCFGAGLFQLLMTDPATQAMTNQPLGGEGGGAIGWLIDVVLMEYLDKAVAALILIVIDLVLLLFALSTSVSAVLNGVKSFFGREDDGEAKKNEKVARQLTAKGAEVASGGVEINDPTVAVDINQPKAGKKSARDTDSEAAPTKAKGLVMDSDADWKYPSLNLLEKNAKPPNPGDINGNADIIRNTLAQFDIAIDGKMGANVGPRITQYTMLPHSGTKLKKISALDDELRAALEAKKIRIEAPIPGKREVGVEVPNQETADVRLFGMFQSDEWQKAKSELSFAVGRDTSNHAVVSDLSDMPHLLIAGQTKSGKSVMVNSLLCSLLYRNSPSDLKLIMVDPKMVELGRYKDIPHLITPIITDSSTNPATTVSALQYAVKKMEERYLELSEKGVTNIQEYNEQMAKRRASDDDADAERKMPYIVIVIDEMADLMMAAGKDVQALIIRLAQKGRAAGVHLVLATQSPRKDVVTGLIKANIPATIAFAVKNYTESVIVLGSNGAEKLLGKGDMLLQTADSPAPRRIQGALVTNDEVQKITSDIRINNHPVEYDPEAIAQPVQMNGRGGVMMGGGDDIDPLFNEVAQFAIENGELSGSNIVTNFQVGYGRSARILAQLEKRGVVGAKNGTKPREVLVGSLDDIE